MLDPLSIFRIFSNVLHSDIVVNAVPVSEIREGVRSMANVYAPDNKDFECSVIQFPNFNDIACRCAYLHKYAPLHTYVVFDAMLKILQKELARFREVAVKSKCFRICSLGGGPGSDIIGVLAALKIVFGEFYSSITIIDCMENWCLTFESVIKELKFGGYGENWFSNYSNDLEWNYIGANLLCDMSEEVNRSIADASVITMVKFISACVCTNTEDMVDRIFDAIKPGALVLYIDNAAGGFTQLIQRTAGRNGLVPVFGPLRHADYEAESLKIERFGYTSCYRTKVTIILLQKASNSRQNRNITPPVSNHLGQNVSKPAGSTNFVAASSNFSSRQYSDINNYNISQEGRSITDDTKQPLCGDLNRSLPNDKTNPTVAGNNYNYSRSNELLSASNRRNFPPKVDNLRRSRSNFDSSAVRYTQPTRTFGTGTSCTPEPAEETSDNSEESGCSCCAIS